MMSNAIKPVDPPPFVSYSINYEDVLLRRLFPDRTKGFFVDVGAEHPVLGNDFYGLYELGWHGINIEPNPSYFGLLEQHRSRDQNLQVALSDVSGQELVFFEVADTGLSTCDPDQADVYATQGYRIKQHNVRTLTLNDVLGTAALPHIDILKVDVEGFEERVLVGNDWTKFRPSVIMVEVTFPQSPARRPSNIRQNLEAAGYHHFHFDNLNDFYADGSFPVPPDATMPPNVFDNFVLFETVALKNENFSLQENFKNAEAYAHSLESERKLLELAVPDLKATISENEVGLVRLQQHNQQLMQASRHEQAVTKFACDIATASILGRTDQVENALAVHIHPASHHHERSYEVGEQSKELVTLQNVVQTAEVPKSIVETIPINVRLEFLNARLQTLSAENNGLVNDIKDLRHENRRLLDSTAQLQGENISLRRALGPAYALNDELALLRGLLEEHLEKIPLATAQSPPIDLHEQQTLLQIRQAAMDQRHEETVNMLDAVYTSTSWRLTKPIRMLKRLIKS